MLIGVSRGTPVGPVAPLFGVHQTEGGAVGRFAKLFERSAPPRADLVVVGLRNPGDGYASTRHNVGFQVANRLANRARVEFGIKAAESRIAEGTLGSQKIAIARPQTFMNDSGKAVGKLLDRYRIEPS